MFDVHTYCFPVFYLYTRKTKATNSRMSIHIKSMPKITIFKHYFRNRYRTLLWAFLRRLAGICVARRSRDRINKIGSTGRRGGRDKSRELCVHVCVRTCATRRPWTSSANPYGFHDGGGNPTVSRRNAMHVRTSAFRVAITHRDVDSRLTGDSSDIIAALSQQCPIYIHLFSCNNAVSRPPRIELSTWQLNWMIFN